MYEYIQGVESSFAVVAEPNRRAILSLLLSSERSVGEILWLHVRDGVVDPATLRVEPGYAPIGRLYANRYVRTHDRVALEANAYLQEMHRRGRA